MEIIKSIKGDETILRLIGWLDTQAAPELAAEIENISGEGSLIMDLGSLEYISSSGLRQIVAAYKKFEGRIVLKKVNPGTLDILKTTGLDKRIRIEDEDEKTEILTEEKTEILTNDSTAE